MGKSHFLPGPLFKNHYSKNDNDQDRSELTGSRKRKKTKPCFVNCRGKCIKIKYGDGTKAETCSVHCASIDLALNIDKTPTAFTVGGYNTKKPIDAEKAFWVIGGTKLGVMTTRAKWAFETKQEADDFIEEFGGKNATFDETIKAAFEDMYEDIKMIRKKRGLMSMNNGT